MPLPNKPLPRQTFKKGRFDKNLPLFFNAHSGIGEKPCLRGGFIKSSGCLKVPRGGKICAEYFAGSYKTGKFRQPEKAEKHYTADRLFAACDNTSGSGEFQAA